MRFVIALLMLAGLGIIVLTVGGLTVYGYYGSNLPDYTYLRNYQPPTATRVYAGNGGIIGEFAREKRIFVPIEFIPSQLIDAFLAAEDADFWSHGGLDYPALIRATWQNIWLYLDGRRLVGGSTITQQVAKNFLLGNERRLERKIREAILAFHLEKALGKRRILELYLNEIYLGEGAYGVAAAANLYFGKNLRDLDAHESAMLAGLPKAPSAYSPRRAPDVARERRNWVLSKMEENGFITAVESIQAQRQPLGVVSASPKNDRYDYGYILNDVRSQFALLLSRQRFAEAGAIVRTSIDTHIQAIAVKSLRSGLQEYDRRHGYRGPLESIFALLPAQQASSEQESHGIRESGESLVATDSLPMDLVSIQTYRKALKEMDRPSGMLESWQLAVVVSLADEQAIAVVEKHDSPPAILRLNDMRWARKHVSYRKSSPAVRAMGGIFSVGDIIMVEQMQRVAKDDNSQQKPEKFWDLKQVPQVDGSILVSQPQSGRIMAMVGGWRFQRSEFNRATMAYRQPGSSVKPFVYLAALDNGLTPNSEFLDAPFVIRRGNNSKETWKPANFSDRFWGDQPLRVGLEKSLNLMTVRLANDVGMDVVGRYLQQTGIVDYLPHTLAHALGAGETTLARLVAAYSALINGGHQVDLSLISHIQDQHGKVIYRSDSRECRPCKVQTYQASTAIPMLDRSNSRTILDKRSAYQVVHMLRGAVQRGTGKALADLSFPTAGKTGTSNSLRDAWFIGLTPELVAGVYVGFDTPASLGQKSRKEQETGASVAAPIVRNFLKQAVSPNQARPFLVPDGISLVQIDSRTGLPASAKSRSVEVAMKTENLDRLRLPQEAVKINTAPWSNDPPLSLSPLDIGPPVPRFMVKWIQSPPPANSAAALPTSEDAPPLRSADTPRQNPIPSSPGRPFTRKDAEKRLEWDIY